MSRMYNFVTHFTSSDEENYVAPVNHQVCIPTVQKSQRSCYRYPANGVFRRVSKIAKCDY